MNIHLEESKDREQSPAPKDDSVAYFDVGAANAVDPNFKRFFLDGKLNYIGFEPDSRSSLEFPGKVHPVALGKRREVKTLHLCRKPEVSSFLTPNSEFINQGFHRPERFDVVEQIDIQVVPMDDYFEEGVSNILKLDVQGFELEVLQGANRILENAVSVELEVEFQELYKNQPLFGEISNFLNSKGFVFVDFTRLVHWPLKDSMGSGLLVFGQALFIKSRESFASMPLMSKQDALSMVLEAFGREDLTKAYNLPRISSYQRSLLLGFRARFWVQQFLQKVTKRQWLSLHSLN